jgi:hypothetical protein
MPRFARIIRPGSLVHIISRFINGEFRIVDDIERQEYLRRAGLALAKSDWRIVSFAIMNSHPHWGAISGVQSFAQWANPLHSGFAAGSTNVKGDLVRSSLNDLRPSLST